MRENQLKLLELPLITKHKNPFTQHFFRVTNTVDRWPMNYEEPAYL
jgi:hypothetical protein